MQKKSREELCLEAKELGLDLSYMPKVVIPNIFKIGEEEWKATMRNGIGSSGAAAALGKNPYKTAAEVVLEKAWGKSMPIGSDANTQYRLDSGHMQEEPLLKWYARQLGYEVALIDPNNPSTSGIKDVSEITIEEWEKWEGKGVIAVNHARYCHPNYPFIFTDMDGVCYPPNREMYVIECKTADSKEFKWKWHSGVWGESNVSVGNLGYIDQARQHMCVANVDRCDIVAGCDFNGENNVVVTIYRNMAEEKKLIDGEAKIWEQVEKGITPTFTTISNRSYENVAYIITPEELSEEPITLAGLYKDTVDEILQLENQIKELEEEITKKEERINANKLALIQAMEGHSLATCQSDRDGYEVKLEISQRTTTTIDSKKFRLEEPELASMYSKTTVGDKKLSVKEVKAKKVI